MWPSPSPTAREEGVTLEEAREEIATVTSGGVRERADVANVVVCFWQPEEAVVASPSITIGDPFAEGVITKVDEGSCCWSLADLV